MKRERRDKATAFRLDIGHASWGGKGMSGATLFPEIAGMAQILQICTMNLPTEGIRMDDLNAGEVKYHYRIFYPSGLQFQLEGRLEIVKKERELYPVVLLPSDEIMILDPRAVIANLRTRTIDYSPRYHPLESYSVAFQSWLAEWPSWGMPGCLPVEKLEQA